MLYAFLSTTALRGAHRVAVLAASLVAAAAGPAAAETFTTIDVPNAIGTTVVAINAGGSVTGYCTSSGTQEGFLRTADGTITTFVASSTADWTAPTGINRQGEITGSFQILPHHEEGFERTTTGTILHFRVKGKGDIHATAINDHGVIAGSVDRYGFVRAHDKTITLFDATYSSGINANGDITGIYHGTHGFVRAADGTITSFDVPRALSTHARGINRKGAIVGWAENNRWVHGFERMPDGNIKTFDVQNSGGTAALAVNGSGVITGNYGLAKHAHGFVGSAQSGFTSFDVPNATDTFPVSINDSGVIAGYYRDQDGNYHGFIRTP